MTDFNNFISKLNNTCTLEKDMIREELDKFFDTKTFMKWHAVKYLFYAWDNKNDGHNSYFYKTKEGIWTQLVYDFDNSFGSLFDFITPQYSYIDGSPLIGCLNITEHNEEYRQILSEVMEKAFNPKKLFPYIDDLVAFLDPYVKEDRTPDANGHRPGQFDRPFSYIENEYTYEEFRKNYYGYKEHNGCGGTAYNCCVKKYKKRDIGSWKIEYNGKFCLVAPECWSKQYGYECCQSNDTVLVEPLDKTNPSTEWYGLENSQWCGILDYPYEKERECWSSIFGYPCCKNETTQPQAEDKYLPNRFYGIEDNHWCGIVDYNSCNTMDGYKCCSHCLINFTDNNGDWGYENNNWCHIPAICYLNK
eukprot:jgi/Orpsp1_1/1188780/evm.model.d7180000067114.1